jgi:hypothetical protein
LCYRYVSNCYQSVAVDLFPSTENVEVVVLFERFDASQEVAQTTSSPTEAVIDKPNSVKQEHL